MESTSKVESIFLYHRRRKIENHQFHCFYSTAKFDHLHDIEGTKNGDSTKNFNHPQTA